MLCCSWGRQVLFRAWNEQGGYTKPKKNLYVFEFEWPSSGQETIKGLWLPSHTDTAGHTKALITQSHKHDWTHQLRPLITQPWTTLDLYELYLTESYLINRSLYSKYIHLIPSHNIHAWHDKHMARSIIKVHISLKWTRAPDSAQTSQSTCIELHVWLCQLCPKTVSTPAPSIRPPIPPHPVDGVSDTAGTALRMLQCCEYNEPLCLTWSRWGEAAGASIRDPSPRPGPASPHTTPLSHPRPWVPWCHQSFNWRQINNNLYNIHI